MWNSAEGLGSVDCKYNALICEHFQDDKTTSTAGRFSCFPEALNLGHRPFLLYTLYIHAKTDMLWEELAGISGRNINQIG